MSFNEKRLRLAELLTEAAELEHGLCCQYLFAGFTLKIQESEGCTVEQLEIIRRWRGTIFQIARQEMEHLGLVSNLLTAIGEAPYFARPDFPTGRHFYPLGIPCELEAFNQSALERFMLFEWPANMAERSSNASSHLADVFPNFKGADLASIEKMYLEIRSLLTALGTNPNLLFIGPQDAQQATADIVPVPLRGIQLPPDTAFYNVLVKPITDLKSAIGAVDQIMTEGEGAPHDREGSHFALFADMLEQLRAAQAEDPRFVPARDVLKNSRTAYEGDETRPNTLTNDATNRLSKLFDLGYSTMMLMLIRFFGHSDETQAELSGLQSTAFFPLMTTFIRPVGEMLTRLPAFADGDERKAGPSFIFPRRLQFMPHKRAAWYVILNQLQLMAQWANELKDEPAFPESIRARLTLVHENCGRMAINFTDAMKLTEVD